MKKFKVATKRIAAVGASAAMISSAVFGAGLSNYPNNFVKNGEFVGEVVVGSSAAASDTTAAMALIDDLASDLSGDSEKVQLTYKKVAAGSESVTVTSSNDKLNLGEALNASEDEFDSDDFSSLLADGTIIDSDYEDEEYDYEQSILIGDASVEFGRAYDMDDETDVPEVYLDLGASGSLYTLHVDFKDTLVVADEVSGEDDEGLANSETITMFGTTLTFDPSNEIDEDGILFASSNIVTAAQGQSVSVESQGKTYNVEVLGANSDSDEVTLSVDGVSKSVKEGSNTRIAGLDVYVDEVFISNIGGDSAAVRLFLGADEITIPISAFDGWTEVEVDGDSLAGYEVRANLGGSGNWTALNDLEFRFTPQDLDAEVEYLRVGDSVADPLFGTLSVEFDGASDSFTDGDMVMVERSSDDAVLTFVNRDGDEYSFEVATGNGANAPAHEDLWTSTNLTQVGEDNVFILQEDTDASDYVSIVYQVERVYSENGDDYVELKDLTDNSKTSYEDGDEIGDSGAFVKNINTTSDKFDIEDAATGGSAFAASYSLYTKGDVEINLTGLAGDVNLTFTENQDDNIDETADVTAASFVLSITSDSDDDIKLSVSGLSGTEGNSESDEESDYEYGLTEMGSYFVLELDQNGEDFVLYTPEEELSYKVNFVAGEAPETMVETIDASTVESRKAELVAEGYTIVSENAVVATAAEFDVDSVTMDVDASGSDMIVVGGPAVNSAARDLLGISAYTMDQAGVAMGEGVARYFADENSVLIYGYSAADTTAIVNKVNAGTAQFE